MLLHKKVLIEKLKDDLPFISLEEEVIKKGKIVDIGDFRGEDGTVAEHPFKIGQIISYKNGESYNDKTLVDVRHIIEIHE